MGIVMSKVTFNPPLSAFGTALLGTKAFSDDWQWETLAVPGGWLFTRREFNEDGCPVPISTTFVPFPR